MKGHTNTVAGVKVSPDGRWAASASYDGSVRLWPMQDEGDAVVLKGHKRNVISVEFVDGGAVLASAGIGGDILLWDVDSGETVGALEGHTTAAGSLQLDPDGDRLWSLGYDGRILVHSLADRSIEREIEVAETRPIHDVPVDGRQPTGHDVLRRGGGLLHGAIRAYRCGYDEGEGYVRRGVLPGWQFARRRVGRRQDSRVACRRLARPLVVYDLFGLIPIRANTTVFSLTKHSGFRPSPE